jgi:hypothetical protein
MSKAKSGIYGLRFGHEGEFRRTVEIGEGKSAQKVQLVFQPQQAYTLTDQELAGLEKELKAGILVPWEEDAKGRQARPGAPAKGAKPQSARVETPPANEPAPSAEEEESPKGGKVKAPASSARRVGRGARAKRS